MFKNKKEYKKEYDIVINNKNYKFYYTIVKIDFFNQKELIFYKKIFLDTVENKKASNQDLNTLISHLRKNKQDFKDIEIATVKQHFVKKEIQEKWEHFVFFAEDKKNKEKVFLYSKEENKTINKKNSFVVSSTFDIFNDNCFFYLEDGIVTILERYFEKIMQNNKTYSFSNEEEMLNEYFFVPHLDNRITKYKKFISLVEDNNNINDIIKKSFENNKSFILEFEDNVFCLSFNWVEEFLLGEIYEDISWNNISIMPFSPKKALVIAEEEVISKIQKYKLKELDFLINSFINFLRLKRNEINKGTFNLSEFLLDNNGLLFCNNEKILYEFKKMIISKDYNNLNETEDFLIFSWREINAKNIIDNYHNVRALMKEQEENIKKTYIKQK